MPEEFDDIECVEVDGVYVPKGSVRRPPSKNKNGKKNKTPVKIKPVISKKGIHFVQGEEVVAQFMSGFNMVVKIIGGIK